jgi:hypothetical protein
MRRQILERQQNFEAERREAGEQLTTATLDHQNEWSITGWWGVQDMIGAHYRGDDQVEIKGAEFADLHLILHDLIVLR